MSHDNLSLDCLKYNQTFSSNHIFRTPIISIIMSYTSEKVALFFNYWALIMCKIHVFPSMEKVWALEVQVVSNSLRNY